MPSLIRLLCIGLICLLAGCALIRPEPDSAAALVLLPPEEGPAPVLIKQRVDIQSHDEQLAFLVVGRFEPQQVRLAALLPTGQPLTTLDYDGETLNQRVSMPVNLPGESILATIQFALWPERSLRKHYRPEQGWALSTETGRRQLWHHGVLLLDIVYDADITRVYNHAQEYKVRIETLEAMDLRT
ncbi:DUF3261 domain-containing protein [Marinobacterium sp. D7]|uniref:DUF3261 domain-containing protein n=1 Tax=Marinobacterium ramblicola TaxID=2849041 RepID=UPI001C2DD879|nr:DUF3261 domain-containing protein [Marinobacterium ramblicola]MBV1788283.1 DUF3261 domain-containing protein [Marinobacterium ramblicola]